ncbi:hypothetical protein CYMTET_42242, partial [Cymbomonas tetramitiformis]
IELERQLGPIEPLSEEAGEKLLEEVTQASGLQAGGAKGLEKEQRILMLTAATQAVTVAGGREKPEVPAMLLQEIKARNIAPGFLVAATMAVALKHPPNNDPAAAVKKLCEQLVKQGEQQVWMHAKYEAALDGIPELRELTTTPFMVEIVTKILPKLEQWQGTDSSMRAQFLLLLSEEAAQMTWACISDWRLKDKPEGAGALPVLQRVQKALDKGPLGDRNDLKQLDVLAEAVTRNLRDRGLLLEQPKLVEMAVEQLKAMSRDSAQTEWLQALPEELRRDRQLLKVGEMRAGNTMSAIERAVGEWAIPHILRSGLQRPPVRRFKIYAMFLEMMVEREAYKASAGAGAFNSEMVRREGVVYAQRLALVMLAENVSKVGLENSSDLFHQQSVWDPFLRDGAGSRHGELRDAARKAAPVRVTGGVLTFIHKTVQEYLCAAGLRGILRTILRDLVVPLETLMAHLLQEFFQADEKGALDATTASVGTVASCRAGHDDRAVRKALQKVGTRLVDSEWAQVDLHGEGVLRDFLADAFLDEPEFVEELHFLALWAEHRCTGGWKVPKGVSPEAVDGGMLLGNVRAVLGGELPKRAGGTLLHAAAADGCYYAASKLLEMRRAGCIGDKILGQTDDGGCTPLFCAARQGHAQMVAMLLSAGAEPGLRPKLQPHIRHLTTGRSAQIDVETHVVRLNDRALKDDHWVVGLPSASPSGGKWRYEVDVRVKYHKDWDNVGDAQKQAAIDLAAIGYCVGWSTHGIYSVYQETAPDSSEAGKRRAVQQSQDPTADDQSGAAPLVQGPLGRFGCLSVSLGAFSGNRNFAASEHHLGQNTVSCGMHNSGVWFDASSGDKFRGESPPALDDPASVRNGVVTVGMLLDCDRRTMHFSTSNSADWKEVRYTWDAQQSPVFPAVSCFGLVGEVQFNFGERAWQCSAPLPSSSEFRPITDLALGNSPVMQAAVGGHMRVCQLLLDHEAITDTGSQFQRTLLHWAAYWGDAALARQVLKIAADGGVDCSKFMQREDGDGRCAAGLAAERGHVEFLQLMKRARADLAQRASDGSTPAHWAAKCGQIEVLRMLRDDARAELTQAARDGSTPVHWAAKGGHLDVLEMLWRESGADLSHQANDGSTALHWATAGGAKEVTQAITLHVGSADVITSSVSSEAKAGHAEVVSALLHAREGKNGGVNAATEDGRTPLHIAAEEGHVEMARALVKAGASVSLTMDGDRTPLFIAAMNGHLEVARLLMLQAGDDVNLHNSDGATPLFVSTEKGHIDLTNLLLEQPGIAVDATNQTGATPLIIAAQMGHVHLAKSLLRKGASVDAQSQDGATALCTAAEKGDVEMVLLLLEENASVLAAKRDGANPLHLAAQNGHVKVAQHLMRMGANVDEADKNGSTPLWAAAHSGHVDVVRSLLDAHASVDVAANNGQQSPLCIAVSMEHFEAARCLVEARAVIKREHQGALLRWAAQQGQDELARQVLEGSGNPVELMQCEDAPATEVWDDVWFLAAVNGHAHMLRLLREFRMVPCDRIGTHLRPQLIQAVGTAAESGQLEVMRELLLMTQCTELADEHGDTPLHKAAARGHLQMVRELLKAEVRVDVANNAGETPLDRAADGGKTSVVRELLLEAGRSGTKYSGDDSRLLYRAVVTGNMEVVRELMRTDFAKATVVDAVDDDDAVGDPPHLCTFILDGVRKQMQKPVREMMREQRGKRLAQCQELRREVYIATDGVGPGDDGKFLVSESNEPKDLLKAVHTQLLESENKSLLLLSGPAGSGKSTFVRHLEVYLETEYVEQTRGERGEVVLVKVSLPTLKNPTADLFREALQQKGLREAQIHELRDLARAGTVQLIFLLDAYDELPSQCLFKNLYMSNSLEQYRDLSEEGAAPLAYPKVIITTRTELLSRAAEYHHAFVPMETGEPARATMEAARAAFLELRIAPFGSKVDAYIHAKVALEVRRELDRQVGALAPLSKEAAEALRAGAGALWRHDALKEGSGGELLDAACAAVTAPGRLSESLERVTRYMRQVPHDLLALQSLPSWPVVWALAGALAETPLGLEQALKSFCEGLARAETGKIWLHRDYRDAFDAIPELRGLTTTPFMVEIVMEILPKLRETRSTDASIKAKLLLLLEVDAVQMVWGCISRWRGPSDSVLLQVQAALEGGSDQAPAQGVESLKKLEEEVVQMLKRQDILLNQPKLVELGLEQLRATGLVSGPMRRRGGGSDGSTAAPDASMDALARPAAEVDWILDEVVEDVIQEEEEGRLLEGTICKVGILYVLKNALCRQKVQGSHIYAMFVCMFVQREARKAVTQIDADTVEREAAQYAQRLALTMVAENVTKVPLRRDSEMFHEESIWDPFLRGGGELLATVQKAAPVQCEGGMLTFIHKTVQEYLCAASLRANLRQILHASAVPLEELTEELLQQELMARHGDAPQPWAQVDLRHEGVVRDFLVDLFLEDVEFISEAAFVVAWAERCCKGGYLAGGGGHACDLLLNNRDDEGRTPLFCAAQSGHAQVVAALLAVGARRDAHSKLRPEGAGEDERGGDVQRMLGGDTGAFSHAGCPAAPGGIGRTLAGGRARVACRQGCPDASAHGCWRGTRGDTSELRRTGVDVGHADKDGRMPVHEAARRGRVEALRFF